jgi:hypothetical protein
MSLENDIESFVKQFATDLPADPAKIKEALQKSEALLSRYHSLKTGGVSRVALSLMQINNALKVLSKKFNQQDQRLEDKRRALSQSEQVKITSLEKTISDLRTQVAAAKYPHTKARLQACLTGAEQEYENILAVKVNGRQAAIRRQELQQELKRLHFQIDSSQEESRRKAIKTRMAQISAELDR